MIKKILDELYWFFYFLFRPAWWLSLHPVSKIWDKELNDLMSKYDFHYETKHTATLGNYPIWISNHPYASFQLEYLAVLPSRKTRKLAYDKLHRDILKNI